MAYIDAVKEGYNNKLSFPEEERTINYFTLYHKISSLRYLKYEYFRSTIFDCMDLLGKEG